MLSFWSPPRCDTVEPSASTASTPSSCRRVPPQRSRWTPPALVAIVPPIVAVSRAARSTAYAARGAPRPLHSRQGGSGARGRPAPRSGRPARSVEPAEVEHDLAVQAARSRRPGRCCRPGGRAPPAPFRTRAARPPPRRDRRAARRRSSPGTAPSSRPRLRPCDVGVGHHVSLTDDGPQLRSIGRRAQLPRVHVWPLP